LGQFLLSRLKHLNLALVVLVAAVLLAACGRATSDTATPTPVPEPDVRERLVAALQRPGMVTQVRIISRQPGEPKEREDVTVAWLDLPQRRTRMEELRGRTLSSITILAGGSQAHYNREGNSLYERPFSLPPDLVQKLPPSLNNPALFGLGLLAMSLWSGQWRPAGTDEWEGHPATLWETDHPGPEGPMHTYATTYLDAQSHLPLAQELRFAQRQGEPPEESLLVTYQVEFVPPEWLPERPFDLQALRGLKANFGGKLEEAKEMGFPVLWLGRKLGLGEGYPVLPLQNLHLRNPDHPEGAFVGFYYRPPYDEPGPPIEIKALMWPRPRWEAVIQQQAGDRAWWRDPSVKREPIIIGGISGEYAIGHRPPPRPPGLAGAGSTGPALGAGYTELLIWLPDTVVRVSATPILVPASTPTPADPSQPRLAATPGTENATDVNPFNSEEAMRLIVRALASLE
jgi:hypothetical protein